jgi:uracil-DNA glycosylase family 4
MSFFTNISPKSNPNKSLVAKCGLCGLYKHCQSPKMEPFGKGKRRILIVGEAPGETEDKEGRPFCGRAGTFQREQLEEFCIDMDRDCWQANTLICHPEKNATPTSKQIDYCYPNLLKTINRLKPEVIIPVGRAAVEAVLKGIWRSPVGPMTRWVGWTIPCREYNCWIVPTYHPSFVLRENNYFTKLGGHSPAEKLFSFHLKQASELKGRPYDKVPNLKQKIKLLYEESEIVSILNNFLGVCEREPNDHLMSFDLETDRLKPDSQSSRIRTVSICMDGKTTIAFPWLGRKVKSAFKALLKSNKVGKIGFNIKFEDRWIWEKLKIRVANWVWDAMVAAHIIDSRKEICSLAFQALVLLGIGTYGEQISPFLEAKHGNSQNRIKHAPLRELLFYNGLDSYCTYFVGMKQRELLGTQNEKN